MSNILRGRNAKVTIESDDCIIVPENAEQFDITMEEDIAEVESPFASLTPMYQFNMGGTVFIRAKGSLSGVTITQKEDKGGKKCKEKIARQIRFKRN